MTQHPGGQRERNQRHRGAGWYGVLLGAVFAFAGCAMEPVANSPGHIAVENTPAPIPDIPPPITQLPTPPELPHPKEQERYSVVVTAVPVREVLFALARDAQINIDITPGLSGEITLNAIDQTLTQILDRIGRQVDLSYRFDNDVLVVGPDAPYRHTYELDYINMTRESDSTVGVSTQIATSGSSSGESAGSGGNNSSSTEVRNRSLADFWRQVSVNLHGILGVPLEETDQNRVPVTDRIQINTLTGLVAVLATHREHRLVRGYLDRLLESSQRQVLIEATIVEVQLNRQNRTGVDWSILGNQGFGFDQSLLGSELQNPPFSVLTYTNDESDLGAISAAVRALETFGDVSVLSSPRLMVLNNQTALLKVVDDRVYFTFEVDPAIVSDGVVTPPTVETEIHTIPVGLVMTVTPQISRTRRVSLNIRPSISRIVNFVQDPNPELRGNLGQEPIISLIPEVQVREIESVLTVDSGSTVVLGGLMQDSAESNADGLPGIGRAPVVGRLFKFQDDQRQKTELVIFLRPLVVDSPDLFDDEFEVYRNFLPKLSDSRGEAP